MLVSGQICWCLISPHRNTTSETWKKRVTDINSSWSLQNYRDRARRWGIQVPRWWGTQIMWDVVVLCALGNKPSDEGAKALNPSLHISQHSVLAWWLDELQESALAKSATSFCFWTACLVCKCLCWTFHIVGACSHCPNVQALGQHVAIGQHVALGTFKFMISPQSFLKHKV